MLDHIAAALLASSLLFLIAACIAWRKRFHRVGSTPHCRRCGYNLTQAEGRCPECGTPLTPAAIARGELRYRARRSIAAILLLGATVITLLLPLTGRLGKIDWVRLRPTRLLFRDMDAVDPAVVRKAWAELERRADAKSLSATEESKLNDLCLSQLTSPNAHQPRDEMLEHVAYLAEQQWLSPEQQTRFYEGIPKAGISVRPRVGPKDSVPFEVFMSGGGPRQTFTGDAGWRYRAEAKQTSIDGTMIRDAVLGHKSSGSWDGGASSRTGSTLPVQAVGHHELAVTLQFSVAYGDENALQTNPRASFSRTFHAPFDVLPVSPAITPLAIPHLAENLKPIFAVRRLGEHSGMIDVNGFAATFEADVLLRTPGGDKRLTTLHVSAGVHSSTMFQSDAFPPDVARVDIILRGTEEAAKHTTNLYATWIGEAALHDVPVTAEGRK